MVPGRPLVLVMPHVCTFTSSRGPDKRIAGFYGVYSVYNVNLEIGKLEVPANSLIMHHDIVVTANGLGNTNYHALWIPMSTFSLKNTQFRLDIRKLTPNSLGLPVSIFSFKKKATLNSALLS